MYNIIYVVYRYNNPWVLLIKKDLVFPKCPRFLFPFDKSFVNNKMTRMTRNGKCVNDSSFAQFHSRPILNCLYKRADV